MLQSDLITLLTESKNYDELKHVWSEWRNQSGRKIRRQYVRYVELMNESARRNGKKSSIVSCSTWRDHLVTNDNQFGLRKFIRSIFLQ
jgi:hypothetical protein